MTRSLSITAVRTFALAAVVLMISAATASAHSRRHHAAHYRGHSRRRAEYVSRREERGGERVATTARAVIGSRDPEAFRKPVTELRGMWVTRYSIQSPAQVYNVVETAKAFGFNALFVQVRGRGDAYYDSALEPRAEDLAREPASFDPLAEVIHIAHANRIQVHAWLNCCLVWSGSRRPKSPEHVFNAHPDWFGRLSDNSFTSLPTDGCEGAFLSPANPAARMHIHDVFLDVVKHYDVDGIHFDYIRYPNASYDFGQSTLAAFCADMRPDHPDAPPAGAPDDQMLAYAKANPDLWGDWRRQQVTTLVEDTCRDARAIHPGLICSAAVFANWQEAYVEKGQDWKRWLRDGALDAVVPMAYSADTAQVAAQITDAEQAAAAAGRYCYAGLGAWHISGDSTAEKIEAIRAVGAQGFVLFSYAGVTSDGGSMAYLHHVAALTFDHPAILPAMAWLDGKSPQTASATVVPTEPGPAATPGSVDPPATGAATAGAASTPATGDSAAAAGYPTPASDSAPTAQQAAPAGRGN